MKKKLSEDDAIKNALSRDNIFEIFEELSNLPQISDDAKFWHTFSSRCIVPYLDRISGRCSHKDYDLIVRWLDTQDTEIRAEAYRCSKAVQSTSWGAGWKLSSEQYKMDSLVALAICATSAPSEDIKNSLGDPSPVGRARTVAKAIWVIGDSVEDEKARHLNLLKNMIADR